MRGVTPIWIAADQGGPTAKTAPLRATVTAKTALCVPKRQMRIPRTPRVRHGGPRAATPATASQASRLGEHDRRRQPRSFTGGPHARTELPRPREHDAENEAAPASGHTGQGRKP